MEDKTMIDIKLPKATTDKWAEMTNANEHRDVRIEIAKFFNLTGFVSIFTAIKEYVENKGRWEDFAIEIYLQSTRTMLYMIDEMYGNKIANRVYNCL